jgi:glycosyltransferase involved in cell wall biosynthesis
MTLKEMTPSIERRQPVRRVLVHGLIYVGRMFAELMDGDGWEFRYYPDHGIHNLASMARDLRECDLVYQIGGRLTLGKFLHAAKLLKKQKLIMHWAGSDVMGQRQKLRRGNANPWVMRNVHHWAVSQWLAEEVGELGLPCEWVPLPPGNVPDQPSPLPTNFSVLVYMPDTRRSELYGLDRILQVARQLPHISFELVGLLQGRIDNPPANLRIHGRIPDLSQFYKRASVVWRPTRHDGLSFMVLEGLGYGRHVLWTYAFPGCVQVTDVADAGDAIARLYQRHKEGGLGINQEGVQVIAERGFLPQHLKRSTLARLERILDQ